MSHLSNNRFRISRLTEFDAGGKLSKLGQESAQHDPRFNNITGSDTERTSVGNRGSRITIRINVPLGSRLRDRCEQTGQSVSEVVRAALELAFAPAALERPQEANQPSKELSAYVFPRDLQNLLPQYRAFGLEAVKQRRRSFHGLLAVCEVVRENTKATQDRALCTELLELGERFGLIRSNFTRKCQTAEPR